MAKVVLEKLTKNYGSIEAVKNINLEIADGEFVVLVGPSGCGKSTTLKMIAGLEEITSGDIKFGEQVVNDLTPKQRNIAMVFQSYALYPHMSVFNNIAFGLKLKSVPKAEIRRLVEDAASILNITELLHRKPRELSGGQRQRVAMGRAIVRNPEAFLFDEPLSNLDANLRAQMRVEIKKLHRKLATTIIYVTHDQVEAMTLADRIVVMNDGRVVQVGGPIEIYENPVSKFVAGFIGAPKMNFIPARLIEKPSKGLALELMEDMVLPVPKNRWKAYAPYVNRKVELGLRPEDLTLGKDKGPDIGTIEATVEVVEPMGSKTLAIFSLNGAEIASECMSHDIREPGQKAGFLAHMDKMHLVDLDNGSIVQV